MVPDPIPASGYTFSQVKGGRAKTTVAVHVRLLVPTSTVTWLGATDTPLGELSVSEPGATLKGTWVADVPEKLDATCAATLLFCASVPPTCTVSTSGAFTLDQQTPD